MKSMTWKNAIFVAIIFSVIMLLTNSASSEDLLHEGLARDRETLQTLLPAVEEIAGWEAVSTPKFFEPQNLWEYINGEAWMYLDYGFKLLIVNE